jgi:hypothetical protein
MKRALAALALLAWAGAAPADLYRWVDPQTGSVKYSSYPPPWYGDEALERRAPKVERIPAGREPPPVRGGVEELPAAAAASAGSAGSAREAPASLPPGRRAEVLADQWREFLTAFAALRQPDEIDRARTTLRPQLEAFQKLSAELDRADPAGAERRAAEAKPVIARLQDVLRPAPTRSSPLLRDER